MKFSLKAKLSLAIALVVLLTVALISFLSNYLIQNQFKGYVSSQQDKTAHQIVESISVQYDADTGSWTRISYIPSVCMRFMTVTLSKYTIKMEKRCGTRKPAI